MIKKYIRDNGDRTITINTKVALGTFFILMMTSLIAVISLAVNAQSDIQHNSNAIIEQNNNQEQIIKLLNDHEKRVTIIETHYDHISQTLNRIENKIEGE